ncbi:hypothetical protein GGI07_000301 [Coemansia sp. Benny D115]|nr:hypothetical protein GGI07_000301 [Coemansia sp. Benny D115]
MAKQPWSWRSMLSYAMTAGAALVLLPFAIPITLTVYAIVWLYTWTHDPRARTNLLRVLPLHPRRVYKCSRALWSGMLDGLGGPTIAIIFSYLAAKLSRSSRPQDTAVRDIKYGPQAKHRLDLFVPLATQKQQQQQRRQGRTGAAESPSEKERFPVLVIFPGYRWSKTKRARMYRPMAQTLCGDGMFVVLPRVGGVDASLEDILCDFHLTVQWVFENAVNFGGDPKRVHLLGYGAGAHLCTMYSLLVPLKTWYAQADRISPDAQLLSSRASDQCLRRWLRKIKRVPRPVAGLILVSGVFDIAGQRKYETERCIENLSATAKAFGGRRELEDAWSPATIVRCLRRRSAFIPSELFSHSVLLIHGKRDSTFVLAQSQRLFRELCEIDVPDVNMKIYANLRRVDPSIALLAPASALAQSLLEDIRASVSPPEGMGENDSETHNRDIHPNGSAGDVNNSHYNNSNNNDRGSNYNDENAASRAKATAAAATATTTAVSSTNGANGTSATATATTNAKDRSSGNGNNVTNGSHRAAPARAGLTAPDITFHGPHRQYKQQQQQKPSLDQHLLRNSAPRSETVVAHGGSDYFSQCHSQPLMAASATSIDKTRRRMALQSTAT